MITYEAPAPADAEELTAMARESFRATFAHLYDPADLAVFEADAFGPQGLPADLSDPALTFRVAREHGRIIGFAKIGPVTLPVEEPTAMQLYQLYLLPGAQGRGIAQALMDWVLAEARARSASAIILSVFTDNHRAQAFYRRYGFVDIGRYVFMVGSHPDEDRLWRMAL